MPNAFDTPEIEFAIDTVRDASLLVRHVQEEMVTAALTKDDRSPVTVADFAAQALVARRLADAFPNDPLVAEEDAAALRGEAQHDARQHVAGFVARWIPECTPANVCDWIDRGAAAPAGRFWTLDPIDGTKGFLRGEQYAIALALIENGRVQLSVLGCPNLSAAQLPEIGGPGSLVLALRGHGAWTAPLTCAATRVRGPDRGPPPHPNPPPQGGREFEDNWTRLHVSNRTNPTDARLLRSVESGHTNTGKIGEVIDALGVRADPVLMDSQAKYAVLAAGAGDVLLRLLSPKRPDYREKIWDQAPGSLVVEEAGGRITDLAGRPLDFTTGRTLAHNRGVLATNGPLHDALLKALGAVGA